MPSDQSDPSAFFRDMAAQWAKMSASGAGQAEGPKAEDFGRMLLGATAAAGNAQAAFKAMADRALAAANVPTRSEVEELGARIGRIEAALFRIEARLGEIAGGTDPAR